MFNESSYKISFLCFYTIFFSTKSVLKLRASMGPCKAQDGLVFLRTRRNRQRLPPVRFRADSIQSACRMKPKPFTSFIANDFSVFPPPSTSVSNLHYFRSRAIGYISNVSTHFVGTNVV